MTTLNTDAKRKEMEEKIKEGFFAFRSEEAMYNVISLVLYYLDQAIQQAYQKGREETLKEIQKYIELVRGSSSPRSDTLKHIARELEQLKSK